MSDIQNPYWDAVKDYVKTDQTFHWDGPQVGGYTSNMTTEELLAQPNRSNLVKAHSWTITDPASLEFVSEYMDDTAFDPMAGTGYWAWLLQQMGHDITAFDKEPMTNHWHNGALVHTHIIQQEGVVSAQLNSDLIMLLSWPPYGSDAGRDIVRNYDGRRIIYIGEGESGCCGSDEMFEELCSSWEEVDSHRPIQWFGLHDWVSIYDRKALPPVPEAKAIENG